MRRFVWGLWLPVSGLILWEALVSAGALDPLFFPPPSVLLDAARRMIASGELPRHVGATLSRAVAGFLFGAVPGLVLGLLMGAVSRIRASVEPLVSALYATPKLSLFPMLMLFLGVGDAARIALVALGCGIITAIHAADAARNINAAYVQMAVNYGAGRMALFRTVYVPACLPQVFTGLRLATGRALVMAVSVELVSSSNGLGSLIWLAWQTFSTERLYIAVLASAALGGLVHWVLRRLERRLVPWMVQNAGS